MVDIVAWRRTGDIAKRMPPVRKNRLIAAGKRRRRIDRLYSCCRDAGKLYDTGALLGLQYWMDVTGQAEAALEEVRSAMATLLWAQARQQGHIRGNVPPEGLFGQDCGHAGGQVC